MSKSEGVDLDILRKFTEWLRVNWIEKQVEQYREEIADIHNWDYLEVQGKENDLNSFLEWLKKDV